MNYKLVLLSLACQESYQKHVTCCFNPHCMFTVPAALMAVAHHSISATVGSGVAAAHMLAACLWYTGLARECGHKYYNGVVYYECIIWFAVTLTVHFHYCKHLEAVKFLAVHRCYSVTVSCLYDEEVFFVLSLNI